MVTVTLATLGYEGLNPEAFFAILHAHSVQTVVDVRELPLSRKPGFSKRALAAAAVLHGVRYLHLRALGCPKPIRHAYREDQDWGQYQAHYLHHLDGQAETLQALGDLVQAERCVLVCFEADYQVCHRSLVATRLVSQIRDLCVQHLAATPVARPAAVAAT